MPGCPIHARDTNGYDSPVVPSLPLRRAAAMEGVASANKMRTKEVILSQTGTGAVLGAGMQINSQNSKLVFFNEPEKTFFPSLALSCSINEIPVLLLCSAKVPILLAVSRTQDAGLDCFANERVAVSLPLWLSPWLGWIWATPSSTGRVTALGQKGDSTNCPFTSKLCFLFSPLPAHWCPNDRLGPGPADRCLLRFSRRIS